MAGSGQAKWLTIFVTMTQKIPEVRVPPNTPNRMKHITVCVCTYKRPLLLERLLQELDNQDTENLFTYSIVVAENDRSQSARPVVMKFAAASKIPVKYCLEPVQNIALARNRAIENATGDFVAFIDDDEYPAKQWLLFLFKACDMHGVDGVLGPVMPLFGYGVPRWIVEGRFYDRPRYPTGVRLDWSQTRTGNVLLKSHLFAGDAQPFRAQCLEGSDQEFFKRMMQMGRVFTWYDEAVVHEVVPPQRWTRSFLIRQALFRGIFSVRNHGFPLPLIATSAIAVPAYALALPLSLLLGQATFMSYVYRLSYHAGRLLALLGINPIRQAYVTD